MKKLIINADDLGADEPRNAGIFDGIEAGTVTSASILPNGPALPDALKRIHAGPFRNVSWGVHLNLSEGRAVATGSPILLEADGTFKGKGPTQHLLMQEGNRDLEREVAHEIDIQISLLKASGISLRHLDGHQHVHVFPAVLKAVIEASFKHHIPWIRMVCEPEPIPYDATLTPSLHEEGRLFSALGRRARSVISEAGRHMPDHFRGLYLKGRLILQRLESLLKCLPDGLTELMVHPGRDIETTVETPFSRFSTIERRQELETLLDPRLPLILEELNITLTPFPKDMY